jgi:PAS domain-containing protein
MAQQAIELILFRQLATSLAVPVFLVDEHGDLVFLNEAAEGLLGIRFDDIDQLPFETWTTMFRPCTPDGRTMPGESLPLAQAVLHRRPAHGTVRVTGGDGVDRTIEATAFPLEGGRGRLIGAVAMFWERPDE